jgi:phage host-nuclease inhibitor protein Gam
MFGRRDRVHEDAEGRKDDGVVLVTINIKQIDRITREVETLVIHRNDGATLYKATYQSKLTEFAAYNQASEIVRKYCESENLIIDGDIRTTAKLPTVRTLRNKRSR